MASILKITCGGQIYRVVLAETMDFDTVDAAIHRVLPGFGAPDASFTSVGGQPHPLAHDTFEAFRETRKELSSGQAVLRLDVSKTSQEPAPPALESQPTPVRSSRPPLIAWQEDDRPLDQLVAALEPAGHGKKTVTGKAKKRTKKAALAADVQEDECASSTCNETIDKYSCVGEDEGSDQQHPFSSSIPMLPKELHRSASCPARSVPVADGEGDDAASDAEEEVPAEPIEVWPPTPTSTPPHSPRASLEYYEPYFGPQQFVWVPVLVPAF
jgi:hypothetical protein